MINQDDLTPTLSTSGTANDESHENENSQHNAGTINVHNQKLKKVCPYCDEEFIRERIFFHIPHRCLKHPSLLNEVYDHIDQSFPRLECKLLHPEAKVPSRQRFTDCGLDLSTIESKEIKPGETVQFETGVALSAPPNYYYSIYGRSGLWRQGIVPIRGIIDSGFTVPLTVFLTNTSKDIYQVQKGDRIAQIILHKIEHSDITVVEEFSPLYKLRSEQSFGSSGR